MAGSHPALYPSPPPHPHLIYAAPDKVPLRPCSLPPLGSRRNTCGASSKAPAGLPAIQGIKSQPPTPAHTARNLRPGRRAGTAESPREKHGAPTRGRTLKSPAPLTNARDKPTEPPRRPGGSAHRDLRQRQGAGNLGSWAVHAARPALPALPLAAPPAPSRDRAGAQATPRARYSPGWGCRPPLPGALRAFVRRHRSPPQRRRAHLCSGRDPAAAPESPGAAGAAVSAPGAQFREVAREGRGCPGRGAVGHGWPWLGTAPAGLCSTGFRRTSCLDEGVARSAGAAAPARNLNT